MEPAFNNDVVPVRPGLPVDPVLQLWAGSFSLSARVTLAAGTPQVAAKSNPMRAALYFVNESGGNGFTVGPAGSSPWSGVTLTPSGIPLVMHVRDFPGLVQGEIIIDGYTGMVVSVWQYVLAPQWK